jgi:hypothetical protein
MKEKIKIDSEKLGKGMGRGCTVGCLPLCIGIAIIFNFGAVLNFILRILGK